MSDKVDMTANWNYVIPIEKAEFADDGDWIISGVVAGPGFVDAEGNSFLPEAIRNMASRITDENPLPLLDWHGLNHKNTIVDAELGEIFKSWVNESTGELWVEGRLDKDNPTSGWLRKKIEKGRKFGLSVKGVADIPRPEMRAGKVAGAIADVFPTEISLTTRPFYQPSFGTVITKAIDEAAEAELVEKGDKSNMSKDAPKAADAPMSPEENKDSLLPTVDAEPEKEGVTPVKELPGPDVMQNVAVAEPQEVAVEKSEIQREADALRALVTNIVRQEIGNSTVEPVAPVVPETPAVATVEKSQDDQPVDRLTVIEKALSDLTDKMERVLDNVPESKAPGVLVSKSDVESAKELIESMTPEERMREGFRLMGSNLR